MQNGETQPLMQAASLKDLEQQSEYGEQLRDILDFYVPIALSLPARREGLTQEDRTVKVISPEGRKDLVTKADKDVQALIREAVTTRHPEWDFWGEEEDGFAKEPDPNKRFLLGTDPVEGTTNFDARKDDQWGSVVFLADMSTNHPVIGIVAKPAQRRFYIGVKGSGAYIVNYNENNQVISFAPLPRQPLHPEFSYNDSPHFEQLKDYDPKDHAKNFKQLGDVQPHSANEDDIDTHRDTILISSDQGNQDIFVDRESGAIEGIEYRAGMCFKTDKEMAAVAVILGELDGGIVTDGDGNPWHLKFNSMIFARNQRDYDYMKSLYDKARPTPEQLAALPSRNSR